MADLERSYDFTLEAMGDALDLRDAETEGHSRRVTAYTIALARAMGIAPAEIKVIARGAFLHDIGKMAIPDRILLKPGKLDAEETRHHARALHPRIRDGAQDPLPPRGRRDRLRPPGNYDGTGYPRGLRGDEIPLGARIFAIADTLDAMTSDRPYRKGAQLRPKPAPKSSATAEPSSIPRSSKSF